VVRTVRPSSKEAEPTGKPVKPKVRMRDDVVYFPAGPEFMLLDTKKAIEQYKLDEQQFGFRLLSEDTDGR
jgi:hypothetical protein